MKKHIYKFVQKGGYFFHKNAANLNTSENKSKERKRVGLEKRKNFCGTEHRQIFFFFFFILFLFPACTVLLPYILWMIRIVHNSWKQSDQFNDFVLWVKWNISFFSTKLLTSMEPDLL